MRSLIMTRRVSGKDGGGTKWKEISNYNWQFAKLNSGSLAANECEKREWKLMSG